MTTERLAIFALGALLGAVACAVVLPACTKRYEFSATNYGGFRVDTWTGRVWRYEPGVNGSEVTTPEGWREIPQP